MNVKLSIICSVIYCLISWRDALHVYEDSFRWVCSDCDDLGSQSRIGGMIYSLDRIKHYRNVAKLKNYMDLSLGPYLIHKCESPYEVRPAIILAVLYIKTHTVVYKVTGIIARLFLASVCNGLLLHLSPTPFPSFPPVLELGTVRRKPGVGKTAIGIRWTGREWFGHAWLAENNSTGEERVYITQAFPVYIK